MDEKQDRHLIKQMIDAHMHKHKKEIHKAIRENHKEVKHHVEKHVKHEVKKHHKKK